MNNTISQGTRRNWEKLRTSTEGKLTARANKRHSTKRIIPMEYFNHPHHASLIQTIIDQIDLHSWNIADVIVSLGLNLFKRAGIDQKSNILELFNGYTDAHFIDELTSLDFPLPEDEFDLLGLIYQSYLSEGTKNILGSYYIPHQVVRRMTKNFNLSCNESFLDPCCGSGAFLLNVPVHHLRQLFGIDRDPVAFLMAKINLLFKYKHINFTSQIYCLDYLSNNQTAEAHPIFNQQFNYIATNPPWGGAMDHEKCTDHHVNPFKETFSCFFAKAYQQLQPRGTIRFLFPEAILNVKAHKAIRQFILNTSKLVSITAFDPLFSDVTTKHIDIECGDNALPDQFQFYDETTQRTIDVKSISATENCVFNLLSQDDLDIVQSVKSREAYSLRQSIFALGIVTGDNKNKLSKEYKTGMEPIYTGKDIAPYALRPANHYIVYDRGQLQQVAKDDIYRAPEKLTYKFISDKLIFAYDNGKIYFSTVQAFSFHTFHL